MRTCLDVETLCKLGEHFAAGYFEEADASPVRRWSRAVRRRFENRQPTPYGGGPLYPCGGNAPPAGVRENRFLAPSYSFTRQLNDQAIQAAIAEAKDATVRETLEALRRTLHEEQERLRFLPPPHTVGGNGYTHSIPNYGRVLREGLDAHGRRIERGLAGAPAKADFYSGLQDVLKGVRAWHRKLVEHLRTWPANDEVTRRNRDRLVAALQRVPFQPARTFFEAVVAYNFIYYMDDCDNPGRMDQELQPFCAADGRAEATSLMAAFFENVCANRGWSAAIGGTRPDGQPGYNDITRAMLEAARGRFRPSLELRVRRDMPEEVWDAALAAVATGAGNPAFYNEELYLKSLREAGLGLSDADATWWNGGGCTETMVHGCSNVGSLEAGLNAAIVFEAAMREHLPTASSFETFLAALKAELARTIEELVAGMNTHLEAKGTWLPQPMRSLLIDDCIDRGVDYNAGGARYNWSVVNIAGLSNVADSLAAISEVVFEKKEKTGAGLLGTLAANFEGHEAFRQRLMRCPRFGNGQAPADELAADLDGFVFREFLRHKQWRGGRFLPSCIMFVTYGGAGAAVGATPDGRRAGEPLADSIGPVQGRDTRGPTAMLQSVTRLPLHLALGTPILNLRLPKSLFRAKEARANLRSLIETFFQMGGMQIQLSVVSRADLEDALVHPERHGDLIVRIGGYSEYFTRLDRKLQESVLARTEYELR
ncbi:MAG: hypothetical protein FJ278_00695 [Planctomycetes bacterium]|nr:hypothetical protein [Planctomycetota bacterium]